MGPGPDPRGEDQHKAIRDGKWSTLHSQRPDRSPAGVELALALTLLIRGGWDAVAQLSQSIPYQSSDDPGAGLAGSLHFGLHGPVRGRIKIRPDADFEPVASWYLWPSHVGRVFDLFPRRHLAELVVLTGRDVQPSFSREGHFSLPLFKSGRDSEWHGNHNS